VNIFKTDQDSHNHSLQTLNLIANYDDFMDSIRVIADVGCGAGLDTNWWATKTYTDDNDVQVPYNYTVYGIDKNLGTAPGTFQSENIRWLEQDYNNLNSNLRADVIWSHDSFRFSTNPIETLRLWNQTLNTDGMLVLIVPQTVNIAYNKLVTTSLSHSYFSYNICNLMYMLAVNGFDCRHGHFNKNPNDPWIHCVVYKSPHAPKDPVKTSWYDLYNLDLLPQTACDMINAYGYVRQDQLQTHWLDGQYCDWSKV
jgi:SAM-dependent methyltransferase